MAKRVLITTVPFAARDRAPLDLLEQAGIEYVINPTGKKLTESQLADMIGDFDALVAGTERIGAAVLSRAPRLTLISRVGIGLDSVDLIEAERRGVRVSYTPDAPAPAVAELTVGLMLSLLRHVHVSNAEMHRGEWARHFGRRIAESTIGVIGVGRIGRLVLARLRGLAPKRVLLHDIRPEPVPDPGFPIEWVEKDDLCRSADLVTVHVPLTARTRGLIDARELALMAPDAALINTSRGAVVREAALVDALARGHLSGAAIDVFEQEPYAGPLARVERCLLTAHMGSMSIDCRARMEYEATAEAVRHLTGQPLASPVPVEEYDVQRHGW